MGDENHTTVAEGPKPPSGMWRVELVQPQQRGINVNTPISISILIAILGFSALFYNAKEEITRNQDSVKADFKSAETNVNTQLASFGSKLNSIEGRVSKFESTKETWGFQDQLRWSIMLQRANDGSQGKSRMSVPDPQEAKP